VEKGLDCGPQLKMFNGKWDADLKEKHVSRNFSKWVGYPEIKVHLDISK
jgi:hypothetical protein